MFEDKRKKRRRRIIFLLFFIFIAASFGVGYYLNSDSTGEVTLPKENNQTGYKLPDSLLDPKLTPNPSSDTEIEVIDNANALFSRLDDDIIRIDTDFIFKTIYKRCGHTIEKSTLPSTDEVRLNKQELSLRYLPWSIKDFTSEEVLFERELETYCPKHFILGVNNGYIGVFVYNEEGERILKKTTDISIDILTPADQKALQNGIIADTEDELNLKLEGFSD
ncbi:MAG: BofC C-terminal domain-containing protein [Bacillota bacterium]